MFKKDFWHKFFPSKITPPWPTSPLPPSSPFSYFLPGVDYKSWPVCMAGAMSSPPPRPSPTSWGNKQQRKKTTFVRPSLIQYLCTEAATKVFFSFPLEEVGWYILNLKNLEKYFKSLIVQLPCMTSEFSRWQIRTGDHTLSILESYQWASTSPTKSHHISNQLYQQYLSVKMYKNPLLKYCKHQCV